MGVHQFENLLYSRRISGCSTDLNKVSQEFRSDDAIDHRVVGR